MALYDSDFPQLKNRLKKIQIRDDLHSLSNWWICAIFETGWLIHPNLEKRQNPALFEATEIQTSESVCVMLFNDLCTPPCSTLCNPPEPFPFSLLIWMSPIGVLNIVKFLTNDLFCRTRSTCLLGMGPCVCLDPWGDLYRLLPCEHVLRLLSHPMRKHFFCHRTRRWHLYMLGNL